MWNNPRVAWHFHKECLFDQHWTQEDSAAAGWRLVPSLTLLSRKNVTFAPLSEKQYSGDECAQSHTGCLDESRGWTGERKAPHLGLVAEDIRVMTETNAKHGFLSIYLIRNCMTPCSLYLYVGSKSGGENQWVF